MKYISNNQEFKERLDGLPSDFYFDNREHFFQGCKKIIKQSNIINVNAVVPSLMNFCYLLFDFTIENLEKIITLKLRYPVEVYSKELRIVNNPESLLKTLKSIEKIIYDYKKMYTMTFDEIDNSDLKKYFEPKRFNKKQKLKRQLEIDFSYSIYDMNNDKLIDSLLEVVDSSGVYRIYNFKKQIIYIGKSYNLASRIPSSIKERSGYAFDYAVINNKADTDIYEIYYIAKLQPILNEVSNTGDEPTLVLPDIEFSDIVYIRERECEHNR